MRLIGIEHMQPVKAGDLLAFKQARASVKRIRGTASEPVQLWLIGDTPKLLDVVEGYFERSFWADDFGEIKFVGAKGAHIFVETGERDFLVRDQHESMTRPHERQAVSPEVRAMQQMMLANQRTMEAQMREMKRELHETRGRSAQTGAGNEPATLGQGIPQADPAEPAGGDTPAADGSPDA